MPKRLNVRLVLALTAVTIVALVTSGVAISQILPGYFIDQARANLRTGVGATAVDLQGRINEASEEGLNVLVPEIRETAVIPAVARLAARLYSADVTIRDEFGRQVVVQPAVVTEQAIDQGFRRDPEVERVSARVDIQLPQGIRATYFIELADPYTYRAATMAQIQSALIGAGALALAVALIIGVVAARSLTVPIGRLRRVSSRIAQGHLDERASPSGVLEVDELGQQFNVMADRLAGTLRMLEADRDRLREFVADVSHELRTPIAALRMYTELQKEDDSDPATRREFYERSLEQIERLEWLSTNLLDLSRIDAGIFPLDMQEGDLRDPIQAVVQAISEAAVARGVSLDSRVPAHPVTLRFDRERMIQLLNNVLGNALKFTPRGGSVSVDLAEEGDSVVITVRDTGAGIPEEELPRIFDRFYRGTNTGEARAQGSGLGLAIVRSIVDMHGGEIGVSSVVGEGTEFRIRLPRQPVPHAGDEAEKVNETSRGARPVRNPGSVA
ncbi:MAG TPA: HAMP domain-containing sensor histidine kinase [Candidatus Limnocylindria bacterium]|nr:HAMP domain-containing sensor histidine kinase [Candidatus Limnocylindria bacterium]